MALSIVPNIYAYNSKTLIFTEKTGLYTPANLTGWETPNATIASATSATLQIFSPDDESLGTFDLFNDGLPDASGDGTTNTWPNSSYSDTAFNSYQGKITNVSLGYLSTEVIPDGVYTAVYQVVANSITYTKTIYFYQFSTVECCIDKQFAKIPDDTCCCDTSTITKSLKMKALLDGIKKAAQCFRKERFSRLLTILQTICAGNVCDCN